MSNYTVPLGHGIQSWESPYHYVQPVPGCLNLSGASRSIAEAIQEPIDSPPLEQLAVNARHVVIIVPDATRSWQNSPQMAVAVRECISAVSDVPVTWLVALGQHRDMLESEREAVLGRAMLPGDRLAPHDCDHCTDTGLFTKMGTPVIVDEEVLKADLVVMIGGITYHDMAGFSGGRKSLMPGVSGRRSIVMNHAHCLTAAGINPSADCGLLDGNPMAEDQMDYVGMVLRGKASFLLNTVADGDGRPAAWVAGSWVSAWQAGTKAAISLQTLWIPRKARRVVSSSGGYPFDIDLYQGTKALFAVLESLTSDGALVLVSDLEDSLGPGNFESALRRALIDPKEVLDEMQSAFTVPGYIAVRTVLELRRRPAALVTSRKNVPFPGEVFATMSEAEQWLQKVSGRDGLSVLVPSGNAVHIKVQG